MFKFPPFAGGVTPFRNGASVPSFGAPTLASAMARVEAAELALEAARAQARAAAKAEGKSTRHLFDGHPYVARASAERWCDEARREGEKAMVNILSRSVSMDSVDENSPYRHLATRLDRPGSMERQRAAGAKLEAAGFQDALNVGGYEKAARIAAQVRREEEGSHVTGERIVQAGRRARMSVDTEVPLPPEDSFAAKVIAAGRKRRGEDQ